ncbi:MAG: hypothetical protein AAFV62_04255 [Pseudomonadota bacterium]
MVRLTAFPFRRTAPRLLLIGLLTSLTAGCAVDLSDLDIKPAKINDRGNR